MVSVGHAGQIGAYDPGISGPGGDATSQSEAILREALDGCRELLAERKEDIEKVARLLYERGTVPGDDIHALLEAS